MPLVRGKTATQSAPAQRRVRARRSGSRVTPCSARRISGIIALSPPTAAAPDPLQKNVAAMKQNGFPQSTDRDLRN